MPTQEQYNVSLQTIQNKYIKIELLNFDFLTVDELSGQCIDGNISIDANADIRRTCYVELVVTDSSFDIQYGGKIFLNNYVKIYIGIDNIQTQDITWFNQGIFLIDAPSYDYDGANHMLSFSGLDLMSKLTGARNGYAIQQGVPTVIPQGTNVRQAMIAVVTLLGGFSKYAIDECITRSGNIQNVPYDMTFEVGSTIFDIILALRDILPYYQVYFDIDGNFCYNQIPSGVNEIIIADDDLFNNVVLSEGVNTDFTSVKNTIEVFGRNNIYGYAQDNNPDSPFCVDKVGVIRKVLYGGEYDNIVTNDLAEERATYELYLSTRMQDSISIYMVPVYWLDVNQLINHAIRNTSIQLPYIIKNINFNLSPIDNMTIEAIRYYSSYPTI